MSKISIRPIKDVIVKRHPNHEAVAMTSPRFTSAIRRLLNNGLSVETVAMALDNFMRLRFHTRRVRVPAWTPLQFFERGGLVAVEKYADWDSALLDARDWFNREPLPEVEEAPKTEEDLRRETLAAYEAHWKRFDYWGGNRPDAYSTWPDYVQARFDEVVKETKR